MILFSPRIMFTLLSVVFNFNVEMGNGSGFSAKDDPWNPNPNLACYGRPMSDSKDYVIAHRTLPCRSKVAVCVPRTGKCVLAIVGDRGPFGKKNGKFSSIADLSPRVRSITGHNGYEKVILTTLNDPS